MAQLRPIIEIRYIKRINRARILLRLTNPTPVISHTVTRQLQPYPARNYPPAPAPIKRKRYLTLVASQTQIAVPNVLGLTQAIAVSSITARGLTPVIIGSANSVYPVGTIAIQSPVGGSIVSIGTVVNLTISLGPLGNLPNFIGMTLSDATTLILQIGGVLHSVVYQDAQFPFPEIPRGTVLGQYPLPGTLYSSGVLIDLIVASGYVYYPGIRESVENDPVTVIGSTVFP